MLSASSTEKNMNVAVVGAGIAGLAVTWHLLNIGAQVTVFESVEGASYASTGLLHPYPGKKALKTHLADEGMQAAAKREKNSSKFVLEKMKKVFLLLKFFLYFESLR